MAGLPDRNPLPATAAEQAGGSRCGGTKTRTRVWGMARNNRKERERGEKGRVNIVERDKGKKRENKTG